MQVVVGHVHAACIDQLPVDDGYLVVVAVQEMVQPGEADGVEPFDSDAGPSDAVQPCTREGLVAILVAEAVEEDAHLHALPHLRGQSLQQLAADAVLLELEVVQQYVVLGLVDGLEEVVELLGSRRQELHFVGLIDGHSHAAEVAQRALGGILASAGLTAEQQSENTKDISFAVHRVQSYKENKN